jgi:hypothetical protein
MAKKGKKKTGKSSKAKGAPVRGDYGSLSISCSSEQIGEFWTTTIEVTVTVTSGESIEMQPEALLLDSSNNVLWPWESLDFVSSSGASHVYRVVIQDVSTCPAKARARATFSYSVEQNEDCSCA